MTPLELQLTVGAAPVGVLVSLGWAFVSRPKRRPTPPLSKPAEAAPVAPVGVVRGFAWSVVALTDMFLDEEPSEQRERAYVDALAHGTHIYEEMTQR